MKALEKVLFLYPRMQFLYPSFLYALGLIAIPIVIHLFNLVKPKKVVFSNIQFLKEVELKTSKKVKLKHLLVLLTRIFFVAFLVLLFAQPYLASDDTVGENSKPIVSIYIDNSQSMSAIQNDETYLNTTIKEVQQIINKYPRSTRFQLLDNDFKPNSIFLHQKDKVLDYLTEIEFSNNSRLASEVYARQTNLLSKEDAEFKQIIWLSDMQKSTFGNLNFQKDTSIEHLAFKIGNEQISNASIDSVYLESPFIKKDEESKLFLKVKNSGNEPVNKIKAKLIVEDKEVAQTIFNVAANATETLELTFVLDKEGQNKAVIEIEDNALEFDNNQYLTLMVNQKVNILSISDSTKSNYNKLFKNEEAFNFQYFNVKNIQYNELKKFDLVILEELVEIPLSLTSELKNYDNIQIALVPNKKANQSNYKSFLNAFNLNYSFKSANEKLKVGFPNTENSFFKGVFSQVDNKVNMPEMTSLITITNHNQSILKLIDNQNALVKAGENNNLFVFTGPLSQPSSSFLNHSFIVPVMYKMAMESSNGNRKLYYTIDDKMKNLKMENDFTKSVFSLIKEDLKLTPEQVTIGNVLKFRIDEEKFSPGFYELTNGSANVRTLAFNGNLKEGNFTSIDETEIDMFNDKVIDQDNQSASEVISVLNGGIPLWRYCLYLALLFLMIEILLLRFYKA